MNGSGDVICHGVIVGRKSVLTSAVCMSALQERHVTLGEHMTRTNQPFLKKVTLKG